ncbi:MAG: DinB family protein [Roseobacter sp.]
MIDPRYAQTMARYNIWQNTQLVPMLAAMTADELAADRGAFFGGLLATANHLLWGDTLWMSRFDSTISGPACAAADHTRLHDSLSGWTEDRRRMDKEIMRWADALTPADLAEDMTWFSAMKPGEMSSPISTAVVHFFNHQTHHRGQIHAMLTAAGRNAPVSDLAFMPKDS